MRKNTKHKKRKRIESQNGFTLVEIVVVTAIVALLSVLAIAGALRARHDTNEALAIDTLRLVNASCEMYRNAESPQTFPLNLSALSNCIPPYIDSTITSAIDASHGKKGYYYTYTLVSFLQYTCVANPIDPGITGTRIFFVDESGIIKVGGVDGEPIGG